MNSTVQYLAEALPHEFPFYHLGIVLAEAVAEELTPVELAELNGFSFSIHGDHRGVLAVLFDRGLDASMYAELGNIIASQLATRLGGDTLISPPREFNPAQLMTLLAPGSEAVRRDYSHIHRGISVPVRTLLISAPSEGVVHA